MPSLCTPFSREVKGSRCGHGSSGGGGGGGDLRNGQPIAFAAQLGQLGASQGEAPFPPADGNFGLLNLHRDFFRVNGPFYDLFLHTTFVVLLSGHHAQRGADRTQWLVRSCSVHVLFIEGECPAWFFLDCFLRCFRQRGECFLGLFP